MKILRKLLVLTILLMTYTSAIIVIMWPWTGVGLAVLAAISLSRKGAQLSAHGTAKWADESEISHMIE